MVIVMYEKIFGNYPQVKVINYILINPKREYTKKQIAVGAKISRVTLDSFITDLIKLDILEKEKSKYRLNLNSKIVKILVDAQVNIAELIMKDQLKKSEIIYGEALNDDEFEEFMNSLDYEVDIDEEIDKLENNEHITITREEYENLKNKQKSINSSDNLCEKSEIIYGEALNDDEFEEFMNSLDYEVDIDEEIDKLENNEHITITREEYENLKNKQKSINSSDNLCADFIINGCYPVKSNKRMINYG